MAREVLEGEFSLSWVGLGIGIGIRDLGGMGMG
jgi:hypothetical protein